VLEGLRFQAKSVSVLKGWDLATGKERELLRTDDGWGIALALRPDGRSALLRIEQRRNGKGLGMGLKLIDLADGKLTGLAITPRHTDGTTFTPNSKAVLVAEGRRLHCCDAATGKEHPGLVKALNAALAGPRFEGVSRVTGLRYSP